MIRARSGPAAALRAAAALGLLAAGAAWGTPARAAGAAVPGLAAPGDCPPLRAEAAAGAGPARPETAAGAAPDAAPRRLAAAPRAGEAPRAGRSPGSGGAVADTLAAAAPGEIVDLPASGASPAAAPGPAAVLVVLPRGPAGTGAGELELGEGARIEASFFSPVACAVVARVVGPPGAAPEALVPRLPETALRVPDATYLTAAQARPAPPPEDEGEAGAPETPGGAAGAAGRTAPGEPDPYRDLQHGLARSGAPAAWPVSDGRGAVVAILDSLPALDHRELGAVEAAGDGTPGEPALHGSLVAGVVAAAAGNGFGIAGVAPGARVLAVPVCTARAGGLPDACRLFDVVRGIDRAWDGGARILNLALVGPPNALLERTLERLDGLGAVAVAAAGNDGGREPRHPAAYPTVVGVTAVDREGRLWSRSNRGPGAEIAAPGVEILSTVPGDAFAFADGSSLAAAHVSGLLALLASVAEDPPAARRALFRAGHEPETALAPGLAALPRACDALARLGHPCPGPAEEP